MLGAQLCLRNAANCWKYGKTQFSSRSFSAKCHTVDFLLTCLHGVSEGFSLGFVFQQ